MHFPVPCRVCVKVHLGGLRPSARRGTTYTAVPPKTSPWLGYCEKAVKKFFDVSQVSPDSGGRANPVACKEEGAREWLWKTKRDSASPTFLKLFFLSLVLIVVPTGTTIAQDNSSVVVTNRQSTAQIPSPLSLEASPRSTFPSATAPIGSAMVVALIWTCAINFRSPALPCLAASNTPTLRLKPLQVCPWP